MSRSLFLSPHNDDETLFGAFTIMRERPKVIVAYRSRNQDEFGITAEMRETETDQALRELFGYLPAYVPGYGSKVVDWEQWEKPTPELLGNLAEQEWDKIYAPALEHNGHHQHNALAEWALTHFIGKVTHYLTYTGNGYRTGGRVEVGWTPQMLRTKWRALYHYQSQLNLGWTAGHFINDQREYFAENTPWA